MIQFKPPAPADSIAHYITRFANSHAMPAFLFKKGMPESFEIQHLFELIMKENEEKNPLWIEHIHAYINLLILILRRKGIIANTKNINWENINKIRPVLDYIDNNYAENITTEQLGKLLNLSENYFYRIFKKITGTNPINYINFVRVCKAEKLLKQNINFSDIAYETGFSSQSYFCKTFKKYTRYSPKEYKKMLESQKKYIEKDL